MSKKEPPKARLQFLLGRGPLNEEEIKEFKKNLSTITGVPVDELKLEAKKISREEMARIKALPEAEANAHIDKLFEEGTSDTPAP